MSEGADISESYFPAWTTDILHVSAGIKRVYSAGDPTAPEKSTTTCWPLSACTLDTQLSFGGANDALAILSFPRLVNLRNGFSCNSSYPSILYCHVIFFVHWPQASVDMNAFRQGDLLAMFGKARQALGFCQLCKIPKAKQLGIPLHTTCNTGCNKLSSLIKL